MAYNNCGIGAQIALSLGEESLAYRMAFICKAPIMLALDDIKSLM